MIALGIDKDLGLVFHPAEGLGVNNPVMIALKTGAVTARRQRIHSAAAVGRFHSIGRQRFALQVLELFASLKHAVLSVKM